MSLTDQKTRVIAFHLPQFHPIPENDAWWGKGFTEWANVTRARPLFEGHCQPRLPADLGFYDLRLPEALEAQAELAHGHGIFGFCYHYYWFKGGRRLLDRPVDHMLASGRPNYPFCLCWANENWTRRWDGQHADVLMPQEHDAESDIAFLQSVLPFFRDSRYIRVDGRPVLVIYRATLFPDLPDTVHRWREHARQQGERPPYLIAAESFDVSSDQVIGAGFDATCEFPPHGAFDCRLPTGSLPRFFAPFSGLLLDYEQVVSHFLARPLPTFRRLKTVTLNWDNTARKKSAANIMVNFSLPAYYRWLSGVIEQSERTAPTEERLVFINAWNEWAEGTYLEPDQLHGHAYLEATRAAIWREPYRPPRPALRVGTGIGSRASPQAVEVSGAAETAAVSTRETAANRMRIVVIAVAGNDGDIIEAFVRENLRWVDHLLIFACEAQDETLAILRSLADEGLSLTVRTNTEASDARDVALNRLLRNAVMDVRSDWVLPLDTDEFIDVTSRSDLEAALATIGPRHGQMPWINHVPTSFDRFAELHPLKRIRHRYLYDVPAPDVNPRVWKVLVNCALLRPYVDRYELGIGAHTIVLRGTQVAGRQPIRPIADAMLRHYPVRTVQPGAGEISAHHPIESLSTIAGIPASVRDLLDQGRVHREHTHGTPAILDPYLPAFELRYSNVRRSTDVAPRSGQGR